MIQSYKDRRTEQFALGFRVKGFPTGFERVAMRKLQMVNSAMRLSDLKVPPHNYLEALKRDRLGQHSIRINEQWRVCFRFENGDAYEVEITDYH